MTVRAKFYVYTASSTSYYPGKKAPDQTTVKLHAASGPGNEEWAQATPGGSLELTISNPDAYRQFEVGQYVMLTLEPVPLEPS